MCCQSGRCWQFYSRSQPWCGLRLIKRVHQLRRLTLRRRTRPHRAGRRHTQLRHSVLVEVPIARSVPVQGARQTIVAQARSRIGLDKAAPMRTGLVPAAPTLTIVEAGATPTGPERAGTTPIGLVPAAPMLTIVEAGAMPTGPERAVRTTEQVGERTRTIAPGRALIIAVQRALTIVAEQTRTIALERALIIVAEQMPPTVELGEPVDINRREAGRLP